MVGLTYTPSVWAELSLTTAQKLSFLDNLETMYTQAVSYIDAITHSSSYFTDAECNARYFSAATDGTGSGLIAATLDGFTADEIIAGGTPSGNICWWSGSEASIPGGFVLCNGLNETPDLRNRFVVGAGSHYAVGATGGANTVTTTGTVTIAGHSLTAAEIAKHTHGTIRDYYGGGSGAADDYTYDCASKSVSTVNTATDSAGSGNAHTHSATWAGESSQEKRPPFYAICLIMKS